MSVNFFEHAYFGGTFCMFSCDTYWHQAHSFFAFRACLQG